MTVEPERKKSGSENVTSVIEVLFSGALAFMAFLLTVDSYLISVVGYGWDLRDMRDIDSEDATLVLTLLTLAAICATVLAIVVRQYKTTWIIYGIFLISAGVLYVKALPFF